ncbi:hypothetical protein ACROYT_G002788 [Oculina patagonica]
MCKIKKQVAGNHLVTTGSACVLKWPSSSSEARNQTFVVTTSQVVGKCDLNSSTVWKAEFLPLRWWQRSEQFSLNDCTFHEVSIPCSQNHAITLILIPTESLHSQKWLSGWRPDQLQSSRFQLCHQKENELESQTTDGKQPLCFVLAETASEKDKFSIQCYQLCTDESGSYFLQNHGNKAQLRTLKDFQSTEKPRGSVILNEDGHALGFLAFGENDEILPLFLGQNLIDDTKTAHGSTQGCPGNNGLETQSGGSNNNSLADHNRIRNNRNDEFPSLSIHQSTKDTLEASEPIPGSRKEPLELSFHSFGSQTGEGNGDNHREQTRSSGDGEEDLRCLLQHQAQRRSALGSDAVPNGSNKGNQLGNGVLTRSFSAQPAMTPRTLRKFNKSHSVLPPIPLKSGALVIDVILYKVYVMDTLSLHLDMSCKGIENWRHLANLNDVSTDLQLKFQAGERHCIAEKMFEVLAATDPDLLVGTLKQHLEDLKINNVVLYIRNLNLDDDMKVQEFLELPDQNIPGRVLIMLDLLPEETWQNLGVNLGVDREKLKCIKIDCANQQQNPAGHLMDIIKSSQPTMTIGQLKNRLTVIERNDVAETLAELQEEWTICDLLDDLDLKRAVESMLNGPDNLHLKNYKDLADACGIRKELYQSLQPPCADSPTKEVMDDIIRRRPTYTVETLFLQFRDMKRLDVIEAISCYFVEEDMKAMKRKLKIFNE